MTDAPINVLFCTRGGLHGALVLRELLASPRIRVCGIVFSSRVFRPGDGLVRGALALRQRTGLAYLLYLWSSTSLAEMLMTLSPLATVRAAARHRGIPLMVTDRINDEPCCRFIAAQSPHLLLSAFFDQHIGAAVADMPAAGAVNIHPSLLPQFKGVDPVFFATLRRGECGVSVHRIAAEFDGGNILCQQPVPARSGDSVLRTTARLYQRGAQLLVSAIDQIADGAPGTVQAGGGYDSWPAPAQVRELAALPASLVSPRDLLDLARGRVTGDAP